MVAIWAIKLSALLVIFVTALLFGLIPFKLFGYLSTNQAERAWAQTIIAALNCGAGGIFLGTTFLDLLPEVREGFESIWSEKDLGELHFPLAEFVVIIGFFFVVFLEHSILTCQAKCIKGKFVFYYMHCLCIIKKRVTSNINRYIICMVKYG